MPVKPIEKSFYMRSDVVAIAKELLGKELVTIIDGVKTSGIITETEAYAGIHDRASHAWGGRYTKRTSVMYKEGGVAYVYLCYGIHALFNVVTATEGNPHAVLIRGIRPLQGGEKMLLRTGKSKLTKDAGSGPGKVARLLGITTRHNKMPLFDSENNDESDRIFIQDNDGAPSGINFLSLPRIGIDYAGEDALLPYRFLMKP
jgi:DNA-3-methyladenine glycosylase